MAALVGRERELVQVRERLDAARAGRGSALLVRGEPGIGKSTLLRAIEEEAGAETRVLRATGREWESELPFAALASLLVPVLDRIPSLPGPQATALRGALALEEIAGVDPFAVAAATLGLLALTAEERPLLCIVDDAQWLDAASANAILFSSQRLGDVPVLLLIAARDGEPWPRGLETLASLELGGLSAVAGVELIARDPGRAVQEGVARRLVERTGGNPLALLELQSTLSDDVRSGQVDLPDLLSAGETITELFLKRAEALPATTREALLRASADTQMLTRDVPALEPAERAGVVELRDGRVEFRHPLMRSAVYYGAEEPDRRRAHAELAASGASEDASPRRVLHLARAATGTDEAIAAELETNAHRVLRRGGIAEAGALLELAANLSPNASVRAGRLAQAANTLLFSGDLERAVAVLERADRASDDSAARIAVGRVRGKILLWSGDVMGAFRTLVETGEHAASVDRALGAAIFSEAVWAAMTAAEIRDASSAAGRAAGLADGLGGFLEENAQTLLLRVQIIAGEAGDRADVLTRYRRLAPRDALPDDLVSEYALTLVWLEAFEEAASIIEAGLRRARASGALTTLPLFLGVQCELATWRGDLRAALGAGGEAEQLCVQLGANVSYPYVLAVLARAEALAGLEADAEAHARAALDFSRAHGIASIEIYAACALGALALGQGRHADAVAELEPLQALYAERGIGEPNSMPWLGDLAEAAILASQDAVADRALDDLSRMAKRTGSRWAAGVAARARALRGPQSVVATEIADAAALLHDMPFELARVHLIHGERLRRARRRSDSRLPLRRALESFERIGAESWARRARRELAAAGDVVPDTLAAPEQLLSPQEFQVALLVAEGLTNREAAARLIVSPKTIEYHLANAYRKLGVRSRVELVRRIDAPR